MTKVPDFDDLMRRLSGSLGEAWNTVVSPSRDAGVDSQIASKAAHAAPVVWMLGKVQSGKSSIVRALTGASEAEVGAGFKACTATARIFEYPSDAPVIRFLDTRGLGEAGYDPGADIAVADQQAHLLLVVMKATDPAQDAVLDVVREARRRHPDWPVLVAHTSLHEAYPPGRGHPLPYPFDPDGRPIGSLPGELARMLAWQRRLCGELPGTGAMAFAAIDFTKEEDGMEPRLYGIEALHDALVQVAPDAISSALDAGGSDGRARRAHQHVLGYASAAAAADVVPVAGAVAVPAVQAKMLHSIAGICGVEWDRRMMGEFSGALGAGVLARLATSFGARQLAKLVPVYGQTAGAAAAAAMSFATTYALGMAAIVYLERRRAGGVGIEGVREAYEQALRGAFSRPAAPKADGGRDSGA